ADPGGQSAIPVADWTLLEKNPGATCFRGEYLGRSDLVQVPEWKIEKADFELAYNAKLRARKLPVDFTVRRDDQQFPVLLIDYEGGTRSKEVRVNNRPIFEDAPIQALVMTSDGKLEMHTNAADKENPERKKRYQDWTD